MDDSIERGTTGDSVKLPDIISPRHNEFSLLNSHTNINEALKEEETGDTSKSRRTAVKSTRLLPNASKQSI